MTEIFGFSGKMPPSNDIATAIVILKDDAVPHQIRQHYVKNKKLIAIMNNSILYLEVLSSIIGADRCYDMPRFDSLHQGNWISSYY